VAQLSISKEQEKQMDIIEGYPATTTREEWLAATKLYNDMRRMESVAVDPENFMGEMDVPEETTENEEVVDVSIGESSFNDKIIELKIKLLKEKQLQKEFIQTGNVMLPPRADALYAGAVTNSNQSKSLREKFSQEGFDLAGDAYSGLTGEGDGVVRTPENVSLYKKGGASFKVPELLQKASDYIGDAGVTALGLGEGAFGYLVGGFGDLLIKSGVSEQNAERIARDLISMPEAFAGTPFMLFKGSKFPEIKRKNKKKIDNELKLERQLNKRLNKAKEGEIETIKVGEKNTTFDIDSDAAKLGELARRAAGGDKKAVEELIRLAKINPEALAAAERLGFDLPADVFSDNILMQQVAGLTRSAAATDASSAWILTLKNASDQADRVISELGGSTDLATISERIKTSLTDLRDTLKQSADDLYSGNKEAGIIGVNDAVPRSTPISTNKTSALLNKLKKELGGIKNLNPIESALLKKLTDKKNPLTYAALLREKQNVFNAGMNKGPYVNANEGTLRRIYNALRDDQLDTVEAVGGKDLRAQLQRANRIVQQQKALEDRIVKAYGKEIEGSIARKLKTAITTGAEGDISNLTKVLKTIPEDLKKEAIATAINSLSVSGRSAGDTNFGFSQFSKLYKKLKDQKPVYNEIIKVLGPDAKTLMDDLYIVSKRVTEAREGVIPTGKANQSLVNALTAEGIIGKILNSSVGGRIIQGGAAGAGAVAAGPAGAVTAGALTGLLKFGNKSQIESVGKLLRSQAFNDMVSNVNSQTVAKVTRSPAYKRWAKTMGIGDSRNWIQSALLGSTVNLEQNEIITEEEPIAQSNQSVSLESIIGGLNPSASNKILAASNAR
jgi:hypothetical protein